MGSCSKVQVDAHLLPCALPTLLDSGVVTSSEQCPCFFHVYTMLQGMGHSNAREAASTVPVRLGWLHASNVGWMPIKSKLDNKKNWKSVKLCRGCQLIRRTRSVTI